MFCGGERVAEAFEDRAIACPGCASPMRKEERDGVTVDECPSCKGMWFDHGELEDVARREPAQPEAKEPARFELAGGREAYRKCPRCSDTMARFNYAKISGVMVDACPTHGTYLDADELERISEFLATGGEAASTRFQQAEAERLANAVQDTRQRSNIHRRRGWYFDF